MPSSCEVCGRPIRSEPVWVSIDGATFRVCLPCSKLGSPTTPPKESGPKSGQGPVKSPNKSPAPAPELKEPELELRLDYAKVIKEARERMKMTQEEMGRRIKEKPSVIHLLETGRLKPDEVLAKKLEHLLKVELLVPVEELGE